MDEQTQNRFKHRQITRDVFFRSEQDDICFITHESDASLKLKKVDLDALRALPKEENFTEMKSTHLITFEGSLKAELERSLGIDKNFRSLISWPLVYDSHIVVRVSKNQSNIEDKNKEKDRMMSNIFVYKLKFETKSHDQDSMHKRKEVGLFLHYDEKLAQVWTLEVKNEGTFGTYNFFITNLEETEPSVKRLFKGPKANQQIF
jgi:hypothetical protein